MKGRTHSERGVSVAKRRGNASNILLSAPPLSDAEMAACTEMMDVAKPCEMDVLAITFRRTPDEWLSDYRAHFTDYPEYLKIISSTQMPHEGTVTDGRVVESIKSPSDLTGLGIQIDKYLKHRSEARDGHEATETVLCFDSLTTLLQFVDLTKAFQFVHFLVNRLSAYGVTAHFHIHPDAIDEQAMCKMQTLSDALVAVTKEGVEEVDLR